MDDTNSQSVTRVSGPLETRPSSASNSLGVYFNPAASNSAPSFRSTRPLLGSAEPAAVEPQGRPRGSLELGGTPLTPPTSNFTVMAPPESLVRVANVQPIPLDSPIVTVEGDDAIALDQSIPQFEQPSLDRYTENGNDISAIALDQPIPRAPTPERDPEITEPEIPGTNPQNDENSIALQPNTTPLPQNVESATTPTHANSMIDYSSTKEWKSWKIKYPWLSVLLATTISLITTIAVLNRISKTNNGFAPLRNAPGFLSRDPEVERAIWTQGILYTSFPALVMTFYRTMWESTICSFADRQPYVDLKKAGGRPAEATIMLDYKTEPVMYAWRLAFRNNHYILGFCMLSSVLLAMLAVPLVAFLFTTASFPSNTALPVSILTKFDPMFGNNIPDLRLSLNSAAAIRIQDARSPPWMHDEFAFSQFTTSGKIHEGSASIETIGYSAHLDCEYMSELDYNRTVLPPGTPGVPARATTVEITANDRGCGIAGTISVITIPEFPGVPTLDIPVTYGKAWSTTTCSADSGWSRLSILTARYINSSNSIANFSLISCIPSYRMTAGTLVADMNPSSEPSLKSFVPNRSNMTKYRPGAIWQFYEMQLPAFNCFDKLEYTKGDEFIRHVYRIAAKRFPQSPLRPDNIIDAVLTLFSTTFAVLASADLFKPVDHPMNGTGIISLVESRLIVVSPIAYIIMSILGVVALLNVSLFFYVLQKSILLEEPVGLVSAAGILHNSCVNEIVDNLAKGPEYYGKVSAAIKKQNQELTNRFCFDERQQRIICYTRPGTPRRRWWTWGMTWVKETTNSNTLAVTLKRGWAWEWNGGRRR
ncbi:hypothetical protein BJ875DRAFT_523685 [Amylocarpus encephaloides]|uniref:Uncharacterized protein n=1 Tax=Amylocarpus encephaloides TaxID=45428 RepID=A0A9P8C0F4_9HELO|nr:hypothetical protein BJ875DRAFT_523685 [Amylocarpus encephaloides]